MAITPFQYITIRKTPMLVNSFNLQKKRHLFIFNKCHVFGFSPGFEAKQMVCFQMTHVLTHKSKTKSLQAIDPTFF
jgi:hypothetical protein